MYTRSFFAACKDSACVERTQRKYLRKTSSTSAGISEDETVPSFLE